MTSHDWSIAGADGEPILVTTDSSTPLGEARAIVLFAHGFKGYKEYGFIPALSRRLVDSLPITMHRFNFSHSGMTDDLRTFARPELFEKDTWNKQVFDLDALLDVVKSGSLDHSPTRAPVILIGHSRGGASCLLAAGRQFRDDTTPRPDAIVTISTPRQTLSLAPEAVQMIHSQGYLISPSARTGQSLRIGKAWLEEQESAPAEHDLLALCERIACPVLAAHGELDKTVLPQCAKDIASACLFGESFLVAGANHVFNTSNPADLESPASPQLISLGDGITKFLASRIQ